VNVTPHEEATSELESMTQNLFTSDKEGVTGICTVLQVHYILGDFSSLPGVVAYCAAGGQADLTLRDSRLPTTAPTPLSLGSQNPLRTRCPKSK